MRSGLGYFSCTQSSNRFWSGFISKLESWLCPNALGQEMSQGRRCLRAGFDWKLNLSILWCTSEGKICRNHVPQYDETILNKKSKIRPMTPTAWKAIPQGSIISIVLNPNCSGTYLWKTKKQFFIGVKKFTSWKWLILIDFLTDLGCRGSK